MPRTYKSIQDLSKIFSGSPPLALRVAQGAVNLVHWRLTLPPGVRLMSSRIVLVACVFLALLPVSGCTEDNPYYRAKGRLDSGALDGALAPADATTTDVPRSDAPSRLDTSLKDSSLETQPPRDTTADRSNDQGNVPLDAVSDLAKDLPGVDGLTKDTQTDTRTPDTAASDGGTGDVAQDAIIPVDVPDAKIPDTLPLDTPTLPLDGATDSSTADAALCVEGTTRVCGNTTYPATSACTAGTQTCLQGDWGPCTGAIPPLGVEACNNLDDTCNGTTDENLASTTCGLGACAVTVAACASGSYQACVPVAAPSDTDTTCDGVDDNCNGMVDEGCAECIHVAPTGDDTTGDGSATAPYLTIQKAIGHVSTVALAPARVCVAGGAACTDTPASYEGPFEIPQGISVQGAFESTTWTLCPSSTPGPTLVTKAATGITFSAAAATTSAATELSRFSIQREGPAQAQTLVGVTVDAIAGVVLSNLSITDEPTVNNTYAVNITGGASVEILRSQLFAGNGALEATAVRVANGKLSLRENCDAFDENGLCATDCDQGTLGLFGSKLKSAQPASSTFGLWLKDAAGSSVNANTVCGGKAETSAAIQVAGTATGLTIRRNVVQNSGGDTSAQAIRITACEGAAPSIARNTRITAEASTNTAGVAAILSNGNCHPVIEGNLHIEASSTVGGTVNGIQCDGGSRCAILDNVEIKALASVIDAQAVGVRCTGEAACAKVANNSIRAYSGKTLIGVHLSKSDTTVASNQVTCGCATGSATGVQLDTGARATLMKNTIVARDCDADEATASKYRGVVLTHDGSRNEPVLDENSIAAVGNADHECSSIAVEIGAAQTSAFPVGVFTNNEFSPGACSTAFDFVEASSLRARVVKDNRFTPVSDATPNLYSRAGTSVGGIDAVNNLGDGTTASGNTIP